MLKKLLTARTTPANEEGFTLVEITVTVMILGILSTIGVTTFNHQVRNAQVSTIKYDIRSNLPHVLALNGSIVTPEDFATKVKSTDTNIVSLAVDGSTENGSTQIACVWGTRVFGDNDVVSFYWSSETGKMETGTCLGTYPNAVIVGTSEPAEDPVNHEEEAEEHAHEGEVADENYTNNPEGTTEEPGSTSPETPTDTEPHPEGETGSETPSGTVGNENHTNPPTATTPGSSTGEMRVVICHAQGNSKQSRWTSISPNNNGTLNGHIPNHAGDIVPPIEGVLPNGHNWTPSNIAIWNNGCKKV